MARRIWMNQIGKTLSDEPTIQSSRAVEQAIHPASTVDGLDRLEREVVQAWTFSKRRLFVGCSHIQIILDYWSSIKPSSIHQPLVLYPDVPLHCFQAFESFRLHTSCRI